MQEGGERRPRCDISCCTPCSYDPRCSHFTFVEDWSQCFLKASSGGRKYSSVAVSAACSRGDVTATITIDADEDGAYTCVADANVLLVSADLSAHAGKANVCVCTRVHAARSRVAHPLRAIL